MNYRVWAALLAVYLVWGSTYLAIRYAVQTIPPFMMAGVRFLAAGLILFTWRRLAGDPMPSLKHWKSATIVGLLLLLGGNGAVVWAEQRVVSSITALLIGSVPLFIVLIEVFWPGRPRSNWKIWTGVLIGFIGIAILIDPLQMIGTDQSIDLLGASALIFASLFWAMGSIYASEADLPQSPLMGTSMEMLTGAGGLFIASMVAREPSRLNFQAVSMESLIGLIYLILFGSLVGFASYTWLLRAAPIALVSTYAYVNPLVAVVLGNLIAQEPLSLHIAVSSAVILGSVALINSVRFSRPKLPQEAVSTISVGDD